MKILTKEDASQFVGGKVETFVRQLLDQVRLVGSAYSIPPDSGRKTALARLFAYLLLRNPDVFIYVSGWGVWRSSENLDLFYGYRRSFGETRPLIEAPVHLFERSDEDAFISILCMAFYFVWDASVFDAAGNVLVQISHDEWLEVRTNDEAARKEFATELEKYGMSALPISR